MERGISMLKVAVIGVMAVFLAIPLKKDKAEFGMLVIMWSTRWRSILGMALCILGFY